MLHHAEYVEVLSPETIREEIAKKVRVMAEKYKKKLPKSYINAKTLKRLFGYDKTGESSYIRLYTLDVLSKYVGFDNWSAYLERVRLSEGSGSGNFTGNQINDVCGWQEWRDYRPMTMLYYLLKLKIVFYHILLNIFA